MNAFDDVLADLRAALATARLIHAEARIAELEAELDITRAQRDQEVAWNKTRTEEFTSHLAAAVTGSDARQILSHVELAEVSRERDTFAARITELEAITENDAGAIRELTTELVDAEASSPTTT